IIRRPPRSTPLYSSAASDVYKRQEEHPEAVVVAVAESSGDSSVELDEAIDGLRATVGGTVGVEVAQERFTPLAQGPAQAGDLGNRTRWERVEEVFCDLTPGGVSVLVVDGADQLSALPCDFDGDVG